MIDLTSLFFLFFYRLPWLHPASLVLFAASVIFSIVLFIAYFLECIRKAWLILLAIVMAVCLLVLFPSVYTQYLLSCLDSEDKDVPPKALAVLERQDLPLTFCIDILNNSKESPYLKNYIATLLANKILKESIENQSLVLSQLNEADNSAWKTPSPTLPPRLLVQDKLTQLTKAEAQ